MNAIKIPRFLRMNLDVDVRGLKPGEYRRLFNGINISPFGLDGLDGVISNIVGTELVVNANLQNTSTVLGYLEDPANNRGFFAVMHSGGNHTVYQYNGVISIVLRTGLWAFNQNAGMVFSMSIVGDLLFISDNTSEIKMINVVKAIAGGTYTPTLEEIVLIKRPPQLPLTIATVADGTVSSNNVFGHYFQFYYRYIYSEDERSVFSALSIADRPDPASETNHNAIDVTIQASELIPNTVKQIDYAVRVDGSNEYVIYKSDFPVAGALASRTHRFYNTELFQTVDDSSAIKWNDSVPKTSAAVKFFENRLFCLNNKEGYDYPLTDISGAAISAASGSGNARGSKGRGIYPIGLMFFDNYGRHAGVSKIGEITIPERTYATTINRYNIQWDLTGVTALTAIPTWATHYAVVVGECKNISFFLQAKAADMFFYEEKTDGDIKIFRTTNLGSKYVAVDIVNLAQRNIGYTFNDGDRLVLYGKNGGSVQYKIDVRIIKQVGRFVLIDRKEIDFTNFAGSGHDSSFTPIFEIYTPKTTVGDIYSEIGKKFTISNSGTVGRAFGTLVGLYEGDIEKYTKNSYSYDSAGYSDTDPYGNVLEFVGAEEFEMMNVYDDYFDKWVKGTGRSIARLSSGSKELSKRTALRFGQEYFSNSTINNIATFEALDEQNMPTEGGAGMALAESGRVLVALQQAETTGVYVGQGFIKTTNGNNFLTKTDGVIGDVNKNLGDHGCQNPYTVVSREGRVYYLDLRRGYVIRRSQDGLTRISDYGIRSFIANICRIYRELGPTTKTIIAGWDPKYECYVISFLNVADPAGGPNATLYFYEKTNSWVAFANYFPEFFGTLGTRQIHFSGGGLWIQTNNTNFNNWFGTQVYRTLNIEGGEDSEEKIWTSIEVDIDSIYTPATPATLLKLLAPSTSWTDESTASPAPTLGATQISAASGSFGLIKVRQSLVIPPSAITRVNYKATISNLSRIVEMFTNVTPGDWNEVDAGTPWSVVGDSIEVTMSTVSVTKKRRLAVSIPAGAYTAIYIGDVVKSGLEVGNLKFRYFNNGSEISSKTINVPPTAPFNISEAIVLAQDVDTIEIQAEDTLSLAGSVYFRVDEIRIQRIDSVTTPVELPSISTILATGAGATIDSKSETIIHPGTGSKDYIISHELINLSGGNSARLYVQNGSLGDPEYAYDLVLSFPVGAVLYQTLASNEDVVLLYHKSDGSLQTRINFRDFKQRASTWFSSFFRYISDPNFGSETESKYKSSQKVRGQSAYITINGRSTSANPMKSITVFYEKSMNSYP
jgi:hypothetical protein